MRDESQFQSRLTALNFRTAAMIRRGKGSWVMGKGKKKTNRHCFSLRCGGFMPRLSGYFLFTFTFPIPPPFLNSRLNSDATAVSTSTREGRLEVFDDAWSTNRCLTIIALSDSFNAQRITFRSLAARPPPVGTLCSIATDDCPLNDPHTRVFSPEESLTGGARAFWYWALGS